MEKGVHGVIMGCHDQGVPEIYTEEQLSRVHDMLYNAHRAGLPREDIQKIFSTLPEMMKLEFNYSCWRYCNEGAYLCGKAKRVPS